MIQTAEQKAFAAVHLHGFKENYFFQAQLKLLEFFEDSGNFVIPDDLDEAFYEDAKEAYHQVNTGWVMYKRGIVSQKKEIDQLKAKLAQVESGEMVLVPREPSEKFREKLKEHLDDLWMGEWGCDWDGFLSVDGVDPKVIYGIAIEAAQEQSQ